MALLHFHRSNGIHWLKSKNGWLCVFTIDEHYVSLRMYTPHEDTPEQHAIRVERRAPYTS